jgi:hypothetical protein
VNSLTLESILNDLFKDISGKQGTDLILEGWFFEVGSKYEVLQNKMT